MGRFRSAAPLFLKALDKPTKMAWHRRSSIALPGCRFAVAALAGGACPLVDRIQSTKYGPPATGRRLRRHARCRRPKWGVAKW
jgi:hypothetical protein